MKWILICLVVVGVVYGYDSEDDTADSSQSSTDTWIMTGLDNWFSALQLHFNGEQNVIKPLLIQIQNYLESSVQHNERLITEMKEMIVNFRAIPYINIDDKASYMQSIVPQSVGELVIFSNRVIKNSKKWFQVRLRNFPETPTLDSLNDIKNDLENAVQNLREISQLMLLYVNNVNQLHLSPETEQEIDQIVNQLETAVSFTRFNIPFDNNVKEAINKLKRFHY